LSNGSSCAQYGDFALIWHVYFSSFALFTLSILDKKVNGFGSLRQA